ncbi:MAG: hypothetical protein HYX72_12785 [Acidobacteria bacterium]|nr:hypothetical protein [Acidobacteriota bacterium]
MDHRDKIIADIAERECRRVSRKVIVALQKMTEGMQSGDGSILKNVWDEVCVQVQFQQSVMWDAYLETISTFIGGEVEGLDALQKQAIWLQTDNGMEWEAENEGEGTVTFCEDDITEYILHKFVLSAAADWTNKRIEKYLALFIEFD